MSKKMIVVLFDTGASKMINETVFIDIEDERPDLHDDYMEKAIELAVTAINEKDDEADVTSKDVYDYYVYDEGSLIEGFNEAEEI